MDVPQLSESNAGAAGPDGPKAHSGGNADIRLRLEERYPPLFSRLPDRLFAPLASPNRHRYWSLLCSLHDQRFGPDAPLPPINGYPVGEVTRLIADEIRWQKWDAEEGVNESTPLEIVAGAAFHRLKDCGWLRVDKVGVRDMVTMPPVIAHFMGRLVEFARTGPLFVAGKIRSIEANLRLLLDETADGSSLHEAAEQARSLLEHVRNTGTNVRDLMVELGSEQATATFVRRFFEDFIERVFIGDYKELRTHDHPLARRQEILRIASGIQHLPAHRTRLIAWYRDKRAGGDAVRAEALFERDFQRIDELHRIDEYLDRLDDEIRSANKRALAYLDYRLKAARPLDLVIGQAIDAVLHVPEAVRAAPFAPGVCLDPGRLASPRTEVARAAPGALRKQVMTAEQEARARLMLQARDRRSMSAPKLATFVRGQLQGRDTMASTDMAFGSIEALRALQILCAVSTAGASGSVSLRDNARAMTSGFSVVQTGSEDIESTGVSHIAFDIRARRAPGGQGT